MAKNCGNVQALQSLAAKIGLGAQEKVLSKAAEYERRLQMKSTTAYNISDTGKVVICLDLAASTLGVEFDTKTSMKYSGLKPLVYNNSKKVLENILELNSSMLTVPLLCAHLHCDGVQEFAQKILNHYQKTTKMDIDLGLPQYVCMAVHQACRINKVKVAKSKLIEKSRLKPGQWSKMEAEWTKLVDLHFAVASKKKSRKTTKVLDDGEKIENMEIDNVDKKGDEDQDHQVEPYQQWKQRILAAAYAAIDRQGHNISVVSENDSPKPVNDKDRKLMIQVTDLKLINDSKEVKTATKENLIHDKIFKIDMKNNTNSLHRNRSKSVHVDAEINDNGELDIQSNKPNKKIDKSNKQVENSIKQIDKMNKLIDKSNKQFDNSNNHVDKKDRTDNLHQKKVIILDDDLFCLSPRKSPRKSPQKYKPYQSPVKTKGVRLLFPSDLK